MYLKSLEVHGFKSFANKLIFEFHNGITAIVGPNGSGKSNVADAVRWVLGEQSAKQLRGAKMEDIIFAGTQMRKPLGYAYVAITINNEDHKLDVPYEEVKIARRVYRSGESEYLLNGTSCRLRDIQELLFDTGIGKEGYSIIGQGQIDKILSGKPEERRELFDEAAGIVKFKKRKAAAEKNLAEEELNLQQIELLLTELEKRVGPLEKQSEKAREFLRLRDDLRTLDVNMFLMEYGEIERDLETVKQNLQIAQGDLKQADEEYEQIKAEYEQVEKELTGYGETLENSKESLATARVEKNGQEGNIKVLHEQILAIEQQESHFTERLESLRESIRQSEEERAGYQEQQDTLDEKLSEMQKQQQEAEKELLDTREAIVDAQSRINGCNDAIRDAQTERTNMKSDRERIKTLLEQTNVKRAEMTKKVLENKSKESELLEAMEEQKRLSDEITNKIEGIEANITENRHMIAELERRDKELEERHREAEKRFHMANSRLTSLQNMAERYEGFGQSIRRVMERKERHPGIIGVVADIIRVDKEYEVAIETALGGSIQNIVTADAQTAKDMIEYLKKNRYGRATFLPLTDISGRGLDHEKDILQEDGVLGIGSMLVKTEAKFEELMKYLLGRIVVADHIDHALALARKYHHSLRIVTKEGELINPGGSISGGAYKNNNNLLGRHHEMDTLKEEVASHRNEIRQILKEQEQGRQKTGEQKNAMEDNRRVRQELVIQQNTVKVKYDRARGDYQQNQDDLEQIRRDSQGIEQRKKELSEELAKLDRQIEESENQTNQNDEIVQTLSHQVEELRVQEQELSQKNNELMVKLSTETQSGDFAKQNIERIDQDLEKYRSEMTGLEENSHQASEQKDEKQQEILATEHKIKEAGERIRHLEETIETVGKKKDELTAQHKDFIEKRESLSDTRHSLDTECMRLEEQGKKLEERRNSRANYMWEEYELTYHKAEELKTHTELSLDQMKQETGSLRAKIKNLGDVNVNAIDEYQDVMERYTEQKKQHDDLIDAAKALEGIIQELDDSMRRQFEEQFAEIKNRFDMVFKELFGGGRGTLELMEEEDLLTAGIKINAQPPGKKLQNMMQLSGGEKALTAIALLFAIQSLKPSPFCLLDEIEAALDDSNVNRYAEYLHNLTKDTQFIVITHRRGTMNAADILYGITMQEKGVSTLVSVNLLDEEEGNGIF